MKKRKMQKEKAKKPFYKKWWVWLLAILIIGGLTSQRDEDNQKKFEIFINI